MNRNEIIIDKHSSSIQISNKISALQRKSYNYMLKIAKNGLSETKVVYNILEKNKSFKKSISYSFISVMN
jgi:hypothetical protein